MIRPTVIKLDDKRLFVELPINLVNELLADILARYEGLFAWGEPIYEVEKPELLYRVLTEGYGLEECSSSIQADSIDLRSAQISAAAETNNDFKELGVGRLLVSIMARTLTSRKVQL